MGYRPILVTTKLITNSIVTIVDCQIIMNTMMKIMMTKTKIMIANITIIVTLISTIVSMELKLLGFNKLRK